MGQFHEFVAITVAMYSVVAVLIGLAYIGAWVIKRREEDKTRVIRDAAFVAQVSAEVRRG